MPKVKVYHSVKDVGAELLAILALGSGRDPFACADRLDQEDLYTIQERLLALAEGTAGPKATEKAFPYLYEQTEQSLDPVE